MEKIKPLKPQISWKPAHLDRGQTKSYQGYIKTPSSYDIPQDKSFDLYIQRHMRVTLKQVNLHILFISGGPGQRHWPWNGLMEKLLRDHPNAAIYSFDHRGLGKSGKITDKRVEEINLERLSKITPIDFDDVTLKNAIYDVAFIFEAIGNDSEFSKSSKFGIYGASYGAFLGSQVVAYFPDLLDYSFLLSLPPAPSYRQYLTDDGVAEACELDLNCRNLLGGPDSRIALRNVIKKVTTQPLNFCSTELFKKTPWADKLKKPVSQGRLNQYLVVFFHELLLHRAKGTQSSRDNYVQVMVVVAALKSTADCNDPTLYASKVLGPLLPYAKLSRRISKSNGGKSTNNLVNTLVLLDYYYAFGKNDPLSKTPEMVLSLQPSFIYEKNYYLRNRYLSPFLNRTHTVVKGINTRKTKIVILQGQTDLCTPYLPAYKFYETVNSPLAVWGLFKNGTHYVNSFKCHLNILNDVIRGNEISSECLDRENAKDLDWKFASSSNFKSLWDLSTPPSSTPRSQAINSKAPFFQIRRGAGKTFIVVDLNKILVSTTFSNIILYGILFVGLSISSGALFWYFKWRRRNLNTTLSV